MNPIRIVFLDFDGVLNSVDYRSTRPPLDPKFGWGTPEHEDWSLDKSAIRRLNKIVDATGAMVVVSSMWRLRRTRSDLQGILSRNGFTGTVLWKTPVIGTRGLEVKEYLRTTARKVESFVIIDDDDDFDAFGLDRLVQTTSEYGLLDEHIEQCIAHLERPWSGS